MRISAQLSIGGFLLGLGLGWYIFNTVEISYRLDLFAWLIIMAGAVVVVSSLISWKLPRLPVGGLVSATMVGLVLSLFFTSGFGIVQEFIESGEYRVEASAIASYGGIITADKVYLEVDNFNGPIRVSTWDKGEFSINVTIKAKGSSQKEAEDYLNALKIDLDESVVEGQKRLVLKYDIPPSAQSRYSVEVDAVLPRDAITDLDLNSSNGGIYLTGVEGETLKMATSNGQLVFGNVYAKSIVGITSNGRIDGEIEANSASLTTSNGGIELAIPCTASGDYDLSTSNGEMDLTVSPSQEVGYDLDFSTSNGVINLDLSDLTYSVDERTSKAAKTTGFEGRAIQITIEGRTSNGNVNIDTA